jgi:hypothetical protein
LNGVDNFKHSFWPKSFWLRPRQSVFIRCYHAVFQGSDAVLPPDRQLENKIAVGHPVPLSKRLAEVGNQKTFRRMLALRRRVAYFCAP